MPIPASPPPRPAPPHDGVRRQLRALVAAAQHRAVAALGLNESARTETVVAMLDNNRRRAPGYWIQLVLAMGIATLGLVLSSTAVVIGAMLVSPLMGPIIELGMGFAVGSSFLTLRAFLRVLLSVIVVVCGAALLTVALPFHEVTAEIAARTAPTALDLLVAVFCALTASYTTVRPTSDTTSAAAGTAIGIALVPPLCVAGFGVGTASLTVAGGAALLFTANLSAILVLAVLSFLALGFNQVDAATIERDYIGPDVTRTGKLAANVQRRLRDAFGSRYGLAVRVLIPGIFLAGVYVPLRRALDEVTWEVRARDAIRRVLSAEAPRAVQTSVAVERHSVSLHLVLIGSNDRAAALEERIASAIVSETGVVPTVSINAVPDARTLAAVSTVRSSGGGSGTPETLDIATIRQHLTSAIDAEWPTTTAGALAGWELHIPGRSTPAIVVRHLGAPLGPTALALLANRWSSRFGAQIEVRDAPLEPATVSERLGREREWQAAAAPLLDWVANAERAMACVKAPSDSTRRLTPAQRSTLDALNHSRAATATRLVVSDSGGWSIRVAVGRCG